MKKTKKWREARWNLSGFWDVKLKNGEIKWISPPLYSGKQE